MITEKVKKKRQGFTLLLEGKFFQKTTGESN